MWQSYIEKITAGDHRALARCISIIENEVSGYEELLENIPASSTPVIGITGPPGAGKSSLVNALLDQCIAGNRKVGILCIDPSSAFNKGALLGDRIRMAEWYNNPNIFIRSLATRGSMGGLNPKAIEITELMKAAAFDYIIIETVGVGQTEIEIAGLADLTVVVLVPEAGDEIQTMKAGLMEIADLFVVNKSDRPDADSFVKNLRLMLAPAFQRQQHEIPVVKTIASQKAGIGELYEHINKLVASENRKDLKIHLLAEKTYQLIQQKRMKDVSLELLKKAIASQNINDFNLYRFAKQFY